MAPQRFVGRRSEVARLLTLLTEARNGQGRFVTVVGPAGIGKSRLLAELGSDEAHLGTTLSAGCAPGDAPFTPWTRIAEQARLAEPSMAAVAASAAAATVEVSEPGEIADRLLELWAGLAPPVLVVVDDLHEADPASLAVLHALLPSLAEEPVVLVGAVRAPRDDAAADPGRLPLPDEELPLAGLGSLDVVTLLRDAPVVLPDADLASLAARLLASTGGSPLALTTWLALTDGDLEAAATEVESSLDAPLRRALGQLDDADHEVLSHLAVAPNLAVPDLAALTGHSPVAVSAVLERGLELGLLTPTPEPHGQPPLHPHVADLLRAELTGAERAARHARIAAHLGGDATVPSTVVAHHALLAGSELPTQQLAEVAERAGWEALGQSAFADAGRFLAAAEEAAAGDERRRLRCLLGRAQAAQRAGDLGAASGLAEAAARLAGALGDADALAEAAVRYAYPPEWRAGDPVAATLLAAAETAGPSEPWLAQVLAVRSVVEMRLPIVDEGGSQWSWLTRADVGQPLADRAVTHATRSGDETATVMALLAWRNTHRAPRFLAKRRQASARAQRLAQRLHRFDLLVDAGLRGATDELEAGSRAGFEEGVALVRWAAERSDEPRLLWRAACLEAARGVLDGDLDVIAEQRNRARGIARATPVPGGPVAEQLFGIQMALLAGQRDVLVQVVTSGHPGTTHQLGRAGAALIAAQLDRPGDAERLLDGLVRPLDEESSLLLTAALAGRAAAMIGARTHARWLLATLSPWRTHAAVDAECFWPAVPVAIVTSQLHRLLGDEDAAAADHDLAARSTEVLRSPTVARMLDHPVGTGTPQLTERQLAVLQGMAAGRSNAQLALDLQFSVATIRRETSAIYRTLRVTNRAEAVNEAHRQGLIRSQG